MGWWEEMWRESKELMRKMTILRKCWKKDMEEGWRVE
jgi:hypothetical protein